MSPRIRSLAPGAPLATRGVSTPEAEQVFREFVQKIARLQGPRLGPPRAANGPAAYNGHLRPNGHRRGGGRHSRRRP